MLNHLLVRLTIGCLLVLGIKLSALYFLPMVLLLNTHHKEFLRVFRVVIKNGAHWAPFLYRIQRGKAVAFIRLQYVY